VSLNQSSNLELCAATLTSKLLTRIKEVLICHIDGITLWMDSLVAQLATDESYIISHILFEGNVKKIIKNFINDQQLIRHTNFKENVWKTDFAKL
jgi:hypothetical protein